MATTTSMNDSAREQMVTQQIRTWDVLEESVLDLFRQIRREQFVPAAYRDVAYADFAIPLGHGQHMLSPMLAGRFLQALAVQPGEFVLEGGTGSGFLSACLATSGARVTSFEIHADLATRARQNLAAAGVGQVEVQHGDVFAHVGAAARYDAIVLTGSLPQPESRFEQMLKPGGRLLAVVGKGAVMEARLVTRGADGSRQQQDLFDTWLDPLLNVPSVPTFDF